MCTHLHVDHVGWNTRLVDGRWAPSFPNARYLFGKAEFAHWESERKTQGAQLNDGSFDDSVLPIVEAGKAVMIESDHQPDPLLTITDYAGHTPGSIAIRLRDGGREACFSGDILSKPAVKSTSYRRTPPKPNRRERRKSFVAVAVGRTNEPARCRPLHETLTCECRDLRSGQ
jgi:glyoxylase-like metal-dependent hydrolase (beta-lactamase superfamily II)